MSKDFKKILKNDRYTAITPLRFEEKSDDAKKNDIPDKVHMIPIGEWMHDLYGPMIINNADIREFAQNFNAGVRKGVFITAGHEGWSEQPAVGWVKEVEVRDDGLWGTVEWNSLGLEALSDKQWKFFSPELCRDYEDPETHDLYRNVLTGGALTKSPYFKELTAIVFSDKNIKSNNNKQVMSKSLEEVLALDVSALSDEDKAVIKENADKLTDEQKVSYASVIAPEESEEQKAEREQKEKEDANIAAGLNPDGTPKEDTTKIEASETKDGKIVMSKAQFAMLESMANKGSQAFAKLEAMQLEKDVSTLLFTESNKEGSFLPKSKDTLTAFVKGLNAEQRKSFSTLIKELPKHTAFKEIGKDATVEAGSYSEVETLVNAKMKENPKLKYSEALKAVFSENEGLEARYNEGLPAVKGKDEK